MFTQYSTEMYSTIILEAEMKYQGNLQKMFGEKVLYGYPDKKLGTVKAILKGGTLLLDPSGIPKRLQEDISQYKSTDYWQLFKENFKKRRNKLRKVCIKPQAKIELCVYLETGVDHIKRCNGGIDTVHRTGQFYADCELNMP